MCLTRKKIVFDFTYCHLIFVQLLFSPINLIPLYLFCIQTANIGHMHTTIVLKVTSAFYKFYFRNINLIQTLLLFIKKELEYSDQDTCKIGAHVS